MREYNSFDTVSHLHMNIALQKGQYQYNSMHRKYYIDLYTEIPEIPHYFRVRERAKRSMMISVRSMRYLEFVEVIMYM